MESGRAARYCRYPAIAPSRSSRCSDLILLDRILKTPCFGISRAQVGKREDGVRQRRKILPVSRDRPVQIPALMQRDRAFQNVFRAILLGRETRAEHND